MISEEQWVRLEVLLGGPRDELLAAIQFLADSMGMASPKGTRHRDRDGDEITFGEMLLLRADDEYVCVALTPVGPDMAVSTAWLGSSLGEYRFETAVRRGERYEVARRYETEHDAVRGHHQVVEAVRQ